MTITRVNTSDVYKFKSRVSNDFNDLTENCVYSIENGANAPDSVQTWWVCAVFRVDNNPDYLFQFAVSLTTGRIYIRARNGGNYGAWYVLH